MTSIVLTPAQGEYDSYGGAYTEVMTALEERGMAVELRKPKVREGGLSHAAAELVVTVLEAVEDHVIEIIVGILLAKLGRAVRGERKRNVGGERRAVILGPDGKPIREITLSDEDKPAGS